MSEGRVARREEVPSGCARDAGSTLSIDSKIRTYLETGCRCALLCGDVASAVLVTVVLSAVAG